MKIWNISFELDQATNERQVFTLFMTIEFDRKDFTILYISEEFENEKVLTNLYKDVVEALEDERKLMIVIFYIKLCIFYM